MPEPSDLDRSAVRRQFDRRARPPDPADFLLREVERRMFDRLELIRLQPAAVVDVGCGFGDGVRRLRARWPQAEVLGVDLSPRRIAQAAALDRPSRGAWAQGLLRRLAGRTDAASARATASPVTGPGGPASDAVTSGGAAARGPLGRYLVGDAHRLPLPDASVDLVWSNLAFHWFDDVPAVLGEWYRVIRPDGLLMFSSLGVDTLAELRGAGVALPALPDLHDIGDALVAAGFAEPVMDVERLAVTWTDPARMLAELRGLGGDARRGRARGLATPRLRDRWLAALAARLRRGDPSASLSVGFELVYGHAWCGARKRLPDGYAPIEFRSRAGRGR